MGLSRNNAHHAHVRCQCSVSEQRTKVVEELQRIRDAIAYRRRHVVGVRAAKEFEGLGSEVLDSFY